MSFVVIVKTASDEPLWGGLPADYPVACCEFDTLEQAEQEHPGKLVMRTEDYREYSRRFHEAHPAPRAWKYASELAAESAAGRRWWHFWRYFT